VPKTDPLVAPVAMTVGDVTPTYPPIILVPPPKP